MRLAVLALCALPWVGSATAQETLALDAFYGSWTATALDEDPEAAALGLAAEDFEREFEGTRDGFVAAWTVIHSIGDPSDPTLRGERQEFEFEPAERPGVFGATDNGEPLEGEPLTWARLAGNTLSLYQLTINAAGGYDLASYHHSLAGPEMTATVVLQRDGAATAGAGARLARAP